LNAQRALALTAALALASAAHAGASDSLAFCDRGAALTAGQQDVALRFAAIVRDELDAIADADDGAAALISRSGLDLSRFGIRFSHAAVAWRSEGGGWSARQLYYACDERRPRIYDQGLAGFAMGIDDPALGHVAIVRLPGPAAQSLRRAALDASRALHLLGPAYSANAYPFSLRYQNCNQWVLEMLATAWGDLPDAPDLRRGAQQWLAQAHYDPEPVAVGSHALMFAASFVPFVHLDDHPPDDRFARRLKVSLPATVEAFARAQFPASERVEICHRGREVVVHRGWTPIAEGCLPGAGDRSIRLD
jgi:hypothetical protein